MNIRDEAVEAAVPWITNFLERRGLFLRGKEAEALAGYVLTAAAPFIAAQALQEAASTFHARLPDGTGNGRVYNSHQVARILNEMAEATRVDDEG